MSRLKFLHRNLDWLIAWIFISSHYCCYSLLVAVYFSLHHFDRVSPSWNWVEKRTSKTAIPSRSVPMECILRTGILKEYPDSLSVFVFDFNVFNRNTKSCKESNDSFKICVWMHENGSRNIVYCVWTKNNLVGSYRWPFWWIPARVVVWWTPSERPWRRCRSCTWNWASGPQSTAESSHCHPNFQLRLQLVSPAVFSEHKF